MGLYKRCEHRSQRRKRDECEHPWWACFRKKHVSLTKWTGRAVESRAHAETALSDLKRVIKAGTFADGGLLASTLTTPEALTFQKLAALYVDLYLQPSKNRTKREDIAYRIPQLVALVGPDRLVKDISFAVIEDLTTRLRQPHPIRRKKPSNDPPRMRLLSASTIRSHQKRLSEMLDWAVRRGYITTRPEIRFDRVSNKRERVLSRDEEKRLLTHAAPHLQTLIIAAVDTGMRKGEMLALLFSDIDWENNRIRLRWETTKSQKERHVPISTARLRTRLLFQRLDASGEQKPDDAHVFSNEAGEQIKAFRNAFNAAKRRAKISGLRWHDLRHSYATRLVEHGVPLSQVRDLLGHASITTTERYDNQQLDVLQRAAQLLDDSTVFDPLTTTSSSETVDETLTSTSVH